MIKKDLLQKRDEATKEFFKLDKLTGLTIEQEESDIDFLRDILQAKSIEEINKIRLSMFQSYSFALIQMSEGILDSFMLVDTKKECDGFMELGGEYDELYLSNNKKDELMIKESKILFNKILNFYKKIQKNEKNLLREGRVKFYGKILPTWLSIFSVAWVGIATLFVLGMNLPFTKINALWIIGVWIVGMGGITMFLKRTLYHKKSN